MRLNSTHINTFNIIPQILKKFKVVSGIIKEIFEEVICVKFTDISEFQAKSKTKTDKLWQ